MKPSPETETMLAALGRIPSGLFVLTLRHGDRETGMLASWVQQCSFDPPQVSAAIRKGRYVLDWLTGGAVFTVNVLPEGDKKLIAHFGKGFDESEAAFAGLEARRDGATAPVLEAAHAYLDCRVAAAHDVGDHVLVVGRVVGGAVQSDARPATHVRKSGKHY
ncbi:MAG TPA: flavin reductase family protein [Gemmataceae bacterium]|nr:flavin reductase family protein [Gemmataceae bacterium]